jgi:hypothetical protein
MSKAKNNEFKKRRKALAVADQYATAIFDIYPPEEYTGNSGPNMPLCSPTTYVVTPAEQVVNLMIQIADWLVQE